MLFVYFWLAQTEEKECERKFGKEYKAYKEKTEMFFPKPNFFKSTSIKAGKSNWLTIPALLLFLMPLAFGIARGIKKISIDHLFSYTTEDRIWIAIQRTSELEFNKISASINNNTVIDSLIAGKTHNRREIINYLLPAELYISELPMIKPDLAECHIRTNDFADDFVKVILTQGIHKGKNKTYRGKKLLMKTLTLKPLVEVWIQVETGSIIKIIDLPESQRYQNIPEPIF
jgi:hypothetical protein